MYDPNHTILSPLGTGATILIRFIADIPHWGGWEGGGIEGEGGLEGQMEWSADSFLVCPVKMVAKNDKFLKFEVSSLFLIFCVHMSWGNCVHGCNYIIIFGNYTSTLNSLRKSWETTHLPRKTIFVREDNFILGHIFQRKKVSLQKGLKTQLCDTSISSFCSTNQLQAK